MTLMSAGHPAPRAARRTADPAHRAAPPHRTTKEYQP